MPIKPLANHGYPSGYGLFKKLPNKYGSFIDNTNPKYEYIRKNITVTSTKYFISYSDNLNFIDLDSSYAQIMTNKYDSMGITGYYVKVSSVIYHYNENEKKYKEKQKKKEKQEKQKKKEKQKTIKTKGQSISTKSVKVNTRISLYKQEYIGYAPGHYYKGKPDYYYLKSGAKRSYILDNHELIRGTRPSNSQSFMVVTEVIETTNGRKKFSPQEKEKMKGLWVFIITDNEELTQNVTKEDLKAAEEAGEDVSEFSEAMDLNGTSEGNNPNDIEQEAAPNYTSDEFLIEYEYDVASSSTSEYVKSLENSNYKLKIGNLRSIFGTPHQFLPKTDTRIVAGSQTNPCGEVSDIGRMYGEKILKNMPILYITPGTPDFLAGFNKDQQKSLLGALVSGEANDDVKSLINNSGGRYYSLKFDYTSYFRYVNTMLRSAAVFLGIGDETLNGKALKEYNWMLISDDRDNGAPAKKQEGIVQKATKDLTNFIAGFTGLQGFMGQHWGTLAFYADCGDQVDDSFGNSTTQSQLSSSINSLSDLAKEMHFLVGTVGSNMGLELDELVGGGESGLTGSLKDATQMVDKAIGSNNIVSNILAKTQTILSGGRLIFPEIWADSSYSKSYSCRIKLVSPSGDKLSVFLNILVPIYHVLALTLPRQSLTAAEGYFSPFLIRAYSKGLFNIDMGIITDLSITKGAEAEWTVDGIPTVAEISFTIKELYNNLSMSVWEQSSLEGSEGAGSLNILSNIAELDYIANSCGVNINEQDVWRMIKLAGILSLGGLKDRVELNIFGAFNQYLDNNNAKIFGIF